MSRAGRVMITVVVLLAGIARCRAQSSASLDCSKAISTTSKMVCSDKGLAALDTKMADLYVAAGKSPAVIAQQRRDLFRADSCSSANDARACVETAYQRRIIALEIEQKKAGKALSAKYNCGGAAKNFSASFYNDTEPQSVMLVNGSDHAVALVAMSGSGSRYTAPGIEYWEHQGVAAVMWRGAKMTCKVVR